MSSIDPGAAPPNPRRSTLTVPEGQPARHLAHQPALIAHSPPQIHAGHIDHGEFRIVFISQTERSMADVTMERGRAFLTVRKRGSDDHSKGVPAKCHAMINALQWSVSGADAEAAAETQKRSQLTGPDCVAAVIFRLKPDPPERSPSRRGTDGAGAPEGT